MNLKDLKYFLAVVELEHFGHAARKCNISQPTLSGQIKKLEETLGVVLFERTNRRVMLTETGRQIATHARRIIRDADAIHEIAESARDPLSGKFRLGAFPTLATYVFPTIVPKIRAAMPNLRLILSEEKTSFLNEKLKNGDIDAALLALPVEDEFLVCHELFTDEFCLAVPCGHPLAKHKKVNQKSLQKHKLLLLEEGHCLRDQSLDVCKLQGIEEEQDFRATGLETLRQMVQAGTGITFMPEIAVRHDEPGIVYVPFERPAPSRTIGLVYRKTSPRRQVMKNLINLF